MEIGMRRWLLHRRKQRLIGWPERQQKMGYRVNFDDGRGSIEWQCIADDIASDPAMCAPEVRPVFTPHITRSLPTQPLYIVDHEAPTQATSWDHFYSEETMRVVSDVVDRYATQPMELAEAR